MPAYETADVLTDFPAEAADTLLRLTGAGSGSPLMLVEVRQMGGATARGGLHEAAFSSRDAAYALLLAGVAEPGIEDHGAAVRAALAPWVGGYRMPNFTFDASELVHAFAPRALERLRKAIRTYDPQGVMAIGRALL